LLSKIKSIETFKENSFQNRADKISRKDIFFGITSKLRKVSRRKNIIICSFWCYEHD